MNVAAFLDERHCQFERLPHRPTYGAQRMAHELHVPGRKVAKTVLLRADGGYRFVVAVLPANKKINLKRASKLLGGGRLQLATELDIAARCPDCEFGSLPPFGSWYGMETIANSSLAEDDEFVFGGNKHDEAIRMSYHEFSQLEYPLVAPFAIDEQA